MQQIVCEPPGLRIRMVTSAIFMHLCLAANVCEFFLSTLLNTDGGLGYGNAWGVGRY
jgi:hypothetical protein